jgi:hypothetical protein
MARTEREDHWIVSEGGWKIFCRVHKPPYTPGPLPAVLLIPGLGASGKTFERWHGPIHVAEICRLGYLAMALDLSGRGKSWGNEVYGGPDHQGDVRAALGYLARRTDVDPDRLGVLSLSLGCAAVAGALADGNRPKVAWWMDWEGPSDREIITASGRKLEPADGHALDDEAYWRPREAVRQVGRTGVPYLRYQSIRDHAQAGEHRHAERMIQAAAEGHLPWFQINNHPPKEAPYRINWMPRGSSTANRWMLNHLRSLLTK